jgi:hypothetical protein
MHKPLLILIGISFSLSCSLLDGKGSLTHTDHFLSDSTFVLLADSTSPDGNKKYFQYCYDHGGFGNSRVFWAVISIKDTGLDLTKGLLPDGYKIVGWTSSNQLVIEKWTPYYYKSDSVELKSGMRIFDIDIIVVN